MRWSCVFPIVPHFIHLNCDELSCVASVDKQPIEQYVRHLIKVVPDPAEQLIAGVTHRLGQYLPLQRT